MIISGIIIIIIIKINVKINLYNITKLYNIIHIYINSFLPFCKFSTRNTCCRRHKNDQWLRALTNEKLKSNSKIKLSNLLINPKLNWIERLLIMIDIVLMVFRILDSVFVYVLQLNVYYHTINGFFDSLKTVVNQINYVYKKLLVGKL